MATGTNALVMVEVKRPDTVDGLASMQLERYVLWRLKQLVGDLERSGAGPASSLRWAGWGCSRAWSRSS
jgi:hypothetical protein